MSASVAEAKVDRLVQIRTGFNNIFKTKLEIDAKKLKGKISTDAPTDAPRDTQSQDAPGNASFEYWTAGLQVLVEQKLGNPPKRYIQLGPMEVHYWCDLPKRIAKEFQDDEAQENRILRKLDDNRAKLVDLWAQYLSNYERIAAAADAKGDAQGVAKAIAMFEDAAKQLQKECEQASTELIVAEFQATIKAMGNYTRYKIKAGAKMTVSVVGLITAIVALGTAATPAAPATLVPAIVGIGVSIMSIGKQIGDLSQSVESCEREIQENLDNWKVEYLDTDGRPKKKEYKFREFAGGVMGGLSGGTSEWVFPTIKGTLEIASRHARKLDGLVVKVHELSLRGTMAVGDLKAARALLEQNEHRAAEHGSEQWKKMRADCIKVQRSIATLQGEIEGINARIPELEKRIVGGRDANAEMRRNLKQLQSALGTKNFAAAGRLLAAVALTVSGGAGMMAGGSGGAEHLSEAAEAAKQFHEHLEKITTGIALGVAGFDVLREYTPEAIEAFG